MYLFSSPIPLSPPPPPPPLLPLRGGKFDVFVSVNNSLSAARASAVHFVVDYDCQPPEVEIDSASIPTPANTAALCHLTLTEDVPLWLEPSVSLCMGWFAYLRRLLSCHLYHHYPFTPTIATFSQRSPHHRIPTTTFQPSTPKLAPPRPLP